MFRFALRNRSVKALCDNKNLEVHIGDAYAEGDEVKLTDEQRLQNLLSSTSQHYGSW